MNQWWEAKDGNDISGAITSALESVRDDHRFHSNKMMDWMGSYDDSYSMVYTNLCSSTAVDTAYKTAQGTRANTYNAIQSIIETLSNKLTGVKPQIKVYPSGSDYTLRSEVKKLNSFLYGEFYRLELHKHVRTAFKDALICGNGILKVFTHNKKICVERVHPLQVYVDKMDGMYQSPRQYFQVKPVARHQLMVDFPEKETEIRMASSATDYRNTQGVNQSDIVDVVEAWYLPSEKGMADGRHTIICGDTVLFDNKQYDNHLGPFVEIRWIPNQLGYWGISVCHQLESIQRDIDETCWAIQRAQQYSKPIMLLGQNSGVPDHVIDDDRDDLTIIYYNEASAKPDVKTFSMVNGEMYAHRDNQIAKAHERIGVSQLQASAKKPSQLSSGEALREYADMTSERFLSLEQDLQDFYLKLAKQIIFHAEFLAETEGKYTTTNPQQDVYEEIDWSEISLAEDSYLIHAYAVSGLPNHPSGRKQAVQDYLQAGLITPEEARELLDMPDLDRFRDLAFAGENVVRRTIEKILDGSDYLSPTEYDPLDFALKHGVQSLQLATLNDAPPEVLEALSRYIEEVKALRPPPEPKQAPQRPLQPPQGQ